MSRAALICRTLRAARTMPVNRARQAVRLAGLLCADESGGDLFRTKTSVPSDMRSAEWKALPGATGTWIRERAFFMASVDRMEVLDAFRRVTQRYINGEIGRSEARVMLRDQLDRLNYRPLPGQEGTIKDLRTVDRMNVVLDTNLEMVNGWARHARQQHTLKALPAQQLVRFADRKKKRNWQAIWARALSKVPKEGVTDERQMMALVNHPIWIAISAFHTPYPPFDFNSGMGLRLIPRSLADEFGLLPGTGASPEHRAMMLPQDRGLNETLQSTPSIRSRDLRQQLAQRMRGLAAWDGDRFVFTDPNGTRKYSPEELALIWKEADEAGHPLLQQDVLLLWLNRSDRLVDKNSTDDWEDLQRLLARISPGELPKTLWRGMTLSTEKLNVFLEGLKKNGGLGVKPENPLASFTDSLAAARHYGRTGGQGWSVLMRVQNPSLDFVDLSPLVRSLQERGLIRKESRPPVVTESEWALPQGSTVSVKSVQKNAEQRVVLIELGQIPPGAGVK